MGRHTIGDRRGSVRGAPPDVYVGFGDFGNDEQMAEAFLPVIKFFGFLLKGAVLFLLLMFLLVAWYAFGEPDA